MKYLLVNVFPAAEHSGNQLAVVFADRDLSNEAMQTICNNFGFSETVFVFSGNKLRIFSPGGELPFAGHPTIGAAWAISQQNKTSSFNMTAMKGVIPCEVNERSAKIKFPGSAALSSYTGNLSTILRETNLQEADVELQSITAISTGPHFVLIPVKSRATLENVNPVQKLEGKERPYLVYRESEVKFLVRMFSPLLKDGEDAATGSAACALAAYLQGQGQMSGQAEVFQGKEMGRPCKINIQWSEEGIYLQGEVSLWGQGELKNY